MTTFRHVHFFIKAGVSVEYNEVAQTRIFSLVSLVISLATFLVWAARLLRWRSVGQRYWYTWGDYVAGWRDDLRLMDRVIGDRWSRLAAYPVGVMGTG